MAHGAAGSPFRRRRWNPVEVKRDQVEPARAHVDPNPMPPRSRPEDIDRQHDQWLGATPLSAVLAEEDLSDRFTSYLGREAAFDMSVLQFLAEPPRRRFLSISGFDAQAFDALEALVTAYSVHTRLALIRGRGPGAAASASPEQGSQPAPDTAEYVRPAPVKAPEPVAGRRDPDEVLSETRISRLVLEGRASPGLRQLLARDRQNIFSMSASEFLADNDGEARFRNIPGFEMAEYFELSDLVSPYVELLRYEYLRRTS